MTDELVTHEQVVRWLPEHIREELARSTPCFGGAEHQWRHTSVEMSTMESAFTTTREWWACTVPGCELVLNIDPVVERP